MTEEQAIKEFFKEWDRKFSKNVMDVIGIKFSHQHIAETFWLAAWRKYGRDKGD